MALSFTPKSPLILPNQLIPTISTMTIAEPKQVKNCCGFTSCKKKLSLTDMSCRCGQRFCVNHRLPETHCCTHDFKKIGLSTLQSQLIKCNGDKMIERL